MWTPPWTRGHNRLGSPIFDADAPGSRPYTIVWRLQDATGAGVYSGKYLIEGRKVAALDPKTLRKWDEEEDYRPHPIPLADFPRDEWEDLPPFTKRRMLFGFRTEDDAERWFGPVHLHIFMGLGARVVPRRAKKVYLSNSESQVIFLPAD